MPGARLLPPLLITAFLAPSAASQDLLPGPGWRWELEPVELPDSWLERGYTRLVPSGSVSLFATTGGLLVVQRAQTTGLELRGAEELQFRPVLVGRDGTVTSRGATGIFGRQDLEMATTSFRGLAPGDVTRFGLAVLDLRGRKEASAAAAREAEELGASVLPLPIVGEPLSFELPTLDGGTVASEDLKGKVVLLDCWATW